MLASYILLAIACVYLGFILYNRNNPDKKIAVKTWWRIVIIFTIVAIFNWAMQSGVF